MTELPEDLVVIDYSGYPKVCRSERFLLLSSDFSAVSELFGLRFASVFSGVPSCKPLWTVCRWLKIGLAMS